MAVNQVVNFVNLIGPIIANEAKKRESNGGIII